jgi:hypothetical protein
MGPDVDINDLRDYWQPAGGRTSSSGTFIPYGVKDVQQFNYNYTWYNNPWYLANEYLKGVYKRRNCSTGKCYLRFFKRSSIVG